MGTVGKTQFGGIYWITLIQFIFVPKRIIFLNMAKACLLLGLMLVSAVFAKHDEWYCKVDSDKFQICRKCKTLGEDCDYEAPDNCKCENMKFANTDYEFVGGPETCQTDDPFCYVSENSNCDDYEYSSVNDRFQRIWLNTEIYYSYDACDANSQDDNVGNEEFLDSTKIIGDRVQEVSDNGILGDDLFFWLDEDYECQDECKSRPGLCGAWSFDNAEGKCYLHTVDGCCGQFGNKKLIQTGYLDMYVLIVGQRREILIVHVQLRQEQLYQRPHMELVGNLPYMLHLLAQLLCKVYPGVRTNVNVFLKGLEEVGSVASNLLVQTILRRK